MDEDKEISAIVERIKSLKKYNTDLQVAAAIGLSDTALYSHKNRHTIPYKKLFAFCESEQISFDWLLTGEGAPYKAINLERAVKRKVDKLTREIAVKVIDLGHEDKREILKYLEEKRLLHELLEERRRRDK